MQFLYWVTRYNDVFTELTGEDRDAALKVVDNDASFDRWWAQYLAKRSKIREESTGKTTISKDNFFKRGLGKTYGNTEAVPGKPSKVD